MTPQIQALGSAAVVSSHAGERLAASYANFYIAGDGSGSHGGIICPAFGAPSDDEARRVGAVPPI